ncbi:unnamed protein product (mitochondrion) [Plasmodiophora brassicae]|uniref:Uncharacterized protein n=2 Tax=Plasmodiophora brassicae TaxID=37360 RepID=A0A3P3YIU8_PLABS|nr:unnamed protein product [Plasmodiophora brassicae]
MTNVEQLAAVRQRLLLVLCAPVRECDDTWFEKVVAWFDDLCARHGAEAVVDRCTPIDIIQAGFVHSDARVAAGCLRLLACIARHCCRLPEPIVGIVDRVLPFCTYKADVDGMHPRVRCAAFEALGAIVPSLHRPAAAWPQIAELCRDAFADPSWYVREQAAALAAALIGADVELSLHEALRDDQSVDASLETVRLLMKTAKGVDAIKKYDLVFRVAEVACSQRERSSAYDVLRALANGDLIDRDVGSRIVDMVRRSVTDSNATGSIYVASCMARIDTPADLFDLVVAGLSRHPALICPCLPDWLDTVERLQVAMERLIVPGLQARGCLASCLRCLMSIDVGVLSDLPHHLTGRCAGLVVDALTSASFAHCQVLAIDVLTHWGVSPVLAAEDWLLEPLRTVFVRRPPSVHAWTLLGGIPLCIPSIVNRVPDLINSVLQCITADADADIAVAAIRAARVAATVTCSTSIVSQYAPRVVDAAASHDEPSVRAEALLAMADMLSSPCRSVFLDQVALVRCGLNAVIMNLPGEMDEDVKLNGIRLIVALQGDDRDTTSVDALCVLQSLSNDDVRCVRLAANAALCGRAPSVDLQGKLSRDTHRSFYGEADRFPDVHGVETATGCF